MKDLSNAFKYLDDTLQDTLNLLEKLCVIPAPSGKEELRAEFVKNWLIHQGATQTYIDEALNVVCPINCEKAKDIIVFMAHTDVVFPDTTPLPLIKTDDKWFNPGIGDDTVCLVMMLQVIKYILDNNLTTDYGVLFVANSCEEGLGNLKGSRQIMKDFGDRVKEFYTFDGLYNRLINKCVGSHRYKISFTTKGGHSFNAFGNENAIAVMANFINELYTCALPNKPDTKTTYNVGIVEGGTSVNTIAQKAGMLFEYRSDDKECLEYMKNFFFQKVNKAKENKNVSIDVELIGDRPCGGDVNIDQFNRICNKCVSICQKHTGMPCPCVAGSTDANVPSSMGIPAVCVGSYMGGGAHTREEYLEIDSIPIGLKITAELILDFFN